jgi:signal transduction histidine kinase
MRALLAGAATRQIAAIVLSSLLTAYGLSAAVWLFFDIRPGPPSEFIAPASEVALTLRVLAALPTEDRTRVLSAVASNAISVEEGDGKPPVLYASDSPEVRGLVHALQASLRYQPLMVGFETPSSGTPSGLNILVSNDLPDNHWLLFRLAPIDDRHGVPLRWISPSGVAFSVTIPLLVGFISLWAARRVTSPLVRLAAATESLSVLRDPLPVTEEGAVEVRQVARAFNSVLKRLQLFVAERTRMLASISHDLRTPLTRLKLRAETMDDCEPRTKMLNDIRTMEAMITSTLAFLRDEAAVEPIERVDIGVLLQTVCDEFNDAGYAVDYEGPSHCGASCRPQAMQRALVNLIDNALQFDARTKARLEQQRDGVVVSIEDDGPGIPDAQKEAVFAPFMRGQSVDGSRRDGSGLGLSIVKAIVESHDGRIALTDRRPHGLCVEMFIPDRSAADQG